MRSLIPIYLLSMNFKVNNLKSKNHGKYQYWSEFDIHYFRFYRS